MHTIRLGYAAEFLLGVLVVFELWSQAGGQTHLDLLPWHVKLVLGVGAAFAIVKATDAAVSSDRAWSIGTLRWLGILMVLLAGCGVASYYAHMNYEEGIDEYQQETPASVGKLDPAKNASPLQLWLFEIQQKADLQV